MTQSSLETLKYWGKILDAPTLSVLPHDYNRPLNGHVVESSFGLPYSDDIKSVILSLVDSAKGSSPLSVQLTAISILVYRLTGDEDIVIATESTDGKPFVLRLNTSPSSTFKELLINVNRSVEEGTSRSIPFNQVSEYIQKQKKLSEPPSLFKMSVQYSFNGKPNGLLETIKGSTKDLAIFVDRQKETLEFHYNSLLFKKQRLQVFAEQFIQILKVSSENPSTKIGSINLITDLQVKLPDPTSDLHWNEFRGPIQDIFSENAIKFPNRDCVVETPNIFDKDTSKRVFSYKQINESSNIVGHYLVKSGIQRGDIVMIYAYRGVDLVIAVMGVLKAGATFSVIDPAYPPARQTIYLSVAKPKGLIVLKKAGILAPSVVEFINKETEIHAKIPSLEILNDGSLIGGRNEETASNADILAPYISLKSKGTGVLVGPDSNPTLSFTSGSEGIPKGVLGRHFSLTYYFPWMAKTFGLSEKDKFTMLSGIAHDPIQRDIFTPLFLGAQLLVPTSDDIGTPGRLAEWMDQYGATVTHLTPAMGQLLSAQATHEISSLHHAFFVGDILTKRDCIRLQSLAENVFIVNMYGTTETQRAVSYYEIPSRSKDSSFLGLQKDIMPAGQGMLDVQLIVVNRNDRSQSCGVGEVGEIYVRAGGLSEGYRGLPDLNKEKFLTNWYVDPKKWSELDAKSDKKEAWREFWVGPRDRLYRTGDLGRYNCDAQVECSGRADDQIKIRGFRIELGEIDTHLSQHPLVRQNITLVRRDKDEEPVLTSYIVPKVSDDLNQFVSDISDDESDEIVKGMSQYRKLIKSIRDHLKKRLASYAVPTVIVPLSKFPLNPNGKVDKPKLPFPDTAQFAAVAKHVKNKQKDTQIKFTPMELKIRDIWLDILPQKPATISPEDSFFDLGGHSILATRMIFEVRKKLVVDVPLGAIFSHPTISGFANEIEKAKRDNDNEINIDYHNTLNENEKSTSKELSYSQDAEELIKTSLLPTYIPGKKLSNSTKITVFLTGATGFLGTFILKDLLGRSLDIKVIAHVRAKTKEAGLERLKNTSIAYGTYDVLNTAIRDNKVEAFIGDIETPKFGLEESQWKQLADEVDVIIHNGALVHWVYPYSTLRGPNVIGTINILNLASLGKNKYFAFVSSTSSLDNEHYVRLSDSLLQEGKAGISEADDLSGSSKDLCNGYGQSKWAAERIIREAGKRGLRGAIIRPGYVTGDSTSGFSNTDDYLIRMIKGSIQLGLIPDIYNTVNMVPVDHVARVVTSSAFHPPIDNDIGVVHVTGHPRLRFNEFLGTLITYGYNVESTDYVPWRNSLEKYIIEDANDNALYPLLHFVLDNLPQNTKAPELDDRNARKSLKLDSEWTGIDLSSGKGVSVELMGQYLSYLIATGFLESPPKAGARKLPEVSISKEVLEKMSIVGGRGLKK